MNPTPRLRRPLSRLRLEDFPDTGPDLAEPPDPEAEARIYRTLTRRLLRRYVNLSVATGRLPSLLGGECARASLTPSSRPSFEDAVIFVLDVERCLDRLDSFARHFLAMRVLEDYSEEETARLLACEVRTVRRLLVEALDRLAGELLRAGLLPVLSCQGGGPVEIT